MERLRGPIYKNQTLALFNEKTREFKGIIQMGISFKINEVGRTFVSKMADFPKIVNTIPKVIKIKVNSPM